MSRNRIILITLGIMVSMFLASMETTVVATAMPTIVGQLGGLEHYAWVFSVFMLTSTTTVPLYGKLSDLYGRRKLYLIAMAIFLAGCFLCGQANSMTQLIFARALQGIGAGGIMPMAFIMVGEMFSLEQRAKMQGVFAGVWGVSSIAGPLLGGYMVDKLSWHWVFYINIVPGLLAAALVGFAWQDHDHGHERPAVDYAGAILLSVSVITLLLGLVDFGTSTSWMLIIASLILFGVLFWVENRAADPILPLPLFRDRLFATTTSHGFLSGWALFGCLSFIPLFVQAVLGTTATEAGITIAPMLLGWVASSIIGTRIMLKVGFRKLAITGTTFLAVGTFLLSRVDADTSRSMIMVFVTLMGIGRGLSIPTLLIAVQSTVERRQLGTATSTLQFMRSIGGTLGVSIMGAALSTRLASLLSVSGLNPEMVTQLLNPLPGDEAVVNSAARLAIADAITFVFIFALVGAGLALIATLFTPQYDLKDKTAKKEPVPVTAD